MILTYWLLFSILEGFETAKILAVFSTPSISHQVVFRPYTQELVRRGHEVIVVTTDPAFPEGEPPNNLTEIDVHEISYKILREKFTTLVVGNKDDSVKALTTVFKNMIETFEKQLESEDFKKILNEKFDLIVVEPCFRPTLLLSHIFKVPVIQFSSFSSFLNSGDILGYPSYPLLYPGLFQQKLYNLNIWEKLQQLFFHFVLNYKYNLIEEEENAMLKRRFGNDAPSIRDLYENVHMLFLNVHPIWEDNRPVPPGVIHVGGIYQKPEEELPKDLKSYLDSSKNGVIYMSFGTNVEPSLLPPEKIQAFVKTFSEQPYNILWKWNGNELPGKSENIRISKWLPQSDLLKHPKVKLFITQGGLQSTDEALAAGVPLIGIPMLADQWYNVEKYVLHDIGIRLDIETLTEDKLKQAIDKIINDDRYANNAKKLFSLMQDTPTKPLETAIWWTEYVLRHNGAKQLRSPSANMSWMEYYSLELIMFSLTIVTIVMVVSFYVLELIVSKFKVNNKKIE